jgi:hypothetical protein
MHWLALTQIVDPGTIELPARRTPRRPCTRRTHQCSVQEVASFSRTVTAISQTLLRAAEACRETIVAPPKAKEHLSAAKSTHADCC